MWSESLKTGRQFLNQAAKFENRLKVSIFDEPSIKLGENSKEKGEDFQNRANNFEIGRALTRNF